MQLHSLTTYALRQFQACAQLAREKSGSLPMVMIVPAVVILAGAIFQNSFSINTSQAEVVFGGPLEPGAEPTIGVPTSAVIGSPAPIVDELDEEPQFFSEEVDPAALGPGGIFGQPPIASSSNGQYLIRPGDTIQGLAERFGVSIIALQRANNVKAETVLIVGEPLQIPAPPIATSAANRAAHGTGYLPAGFIWPDRKSTRLNSSHRL